MDIDTVRFFLENYDSPEPNPNVVGPGLPPWLRDRVPEQRGPGIRPLAEYDLDQRLSDTEVNPDTTVGPSEPAAEIEGIWTDATGTDGFEAYAWYVPFHFAPQRYGIYIREDGLRLLARLLYTWSRDHDTIRQTRLNTGIAASTPASEFPALDSIRTAFDLALEIFLRHEWMHHQVELLAAYLEDASGDVCYPSYHHDVYAPTHPGAACVEETAANAAVYRSRACANLAPSQDLFQLLFHKSTEAQPPGYAQYRRAIGDRFGEVCGHLMRAVLDGDGSRLTDLSRAGSAGGLHLGQRLPLDTAIRRSPVPIYIIESERAPSSIAYFNFIELATDYDIETTERWEDSLATADGSLRERAEKLVPKLEENVNHSGFEWKPCGGNLRYGRLSKKYRFVARRYDEEKRIELVDFGDHELPTEYGCY
jgi:hypothetical protein